MYLSSQGRRRLERREIVKYELIDRTLAGRAPPDDAAKAMEELSNEFYFVFEAAETGVVKRVVAALKSDDVARSPNFSIDIQYGVKKQTLLHY